MPCALAWTTTLSLSPLEIQPCCMTKLPHADEIMYLCTNVLMYLKLGCRVFKKKKKKKYIEKQQVE